MDGSRAQGLGEDSNWLPAFPSVERCTNRALHTEVIGNERTWRGMMGRLIKADIPRWTHQQKHNRPICAGPFFCCITDCDGRIIARNIPTVVRTCRKFDAPRLVKAIVDHVEYRSFTCTDLKEYADELTHHIKKVEELRAVIGSMTALELGRRMKSIEGENFGGYYVKHERRETEGVVWRIYPAM